MEPPQKLSAEKRKNITIETVIERRLIFYKPLKLQHNFIPKYYTCNKPCKSSYPIGKLFWLKLKGNA